MVMTARPFHHGNLRAALLDHAEHALRDHGIDALSLRELARQAGVTHSAPRKHFADRQALLDALAVRGFQRLSAMADAVIDGEGDYEEIFREYGVRYVEFATSDAALMELMFAAKLDDPTPELTRAAEQLFATFGRLVDRGCRDGYFADADVPRLKLLYVATLQGTASLLMAKRIGAADAELLVTDAAALILNSHRGH